jgi:hypothetical protein
MNSDSEAITSQLFTWLLQDTASAGTQPFEDCEPNDGEENPLAATAANSGGESSGWTPQTLELGEIPAVEDRFQAVLERRLKIEIESRPPLFPWETEVSDYPDYVDNPLFELVPLSLWTAQQHHLPLPIPLPENMFGQLLQKCQELVQSSVQLGPKLIQVVNSFFPEESYMTLNDVAALVLMSRTRDGKDRLDRIMSDVESSYFEDLMPQQKMVLSFLAANQLLENFSLPISPTNPVVERQWVSSAGALHLLAEGDFQAALKRVRVQCELPAPGIVTLQGNGQQARAQSFSSGSVSVELGGLQLEQRYTLEVQMPELDPQPLIFTILLSQ